VLSYERYEFNHMPWADRAEPLAPHAASEVMSRLSGWRVSTTVELGQDLLTLGAIPDRHAHTMQRALTDLPSPMPPPDGVRITDGLTRPLDEVFELNEQAFPPEHPDRRHDHRPRAERRALCGELLEGSFLGSLISGTATALAPDDSLVGVIAVFGLGEEATTLPWIGTVYRSPDPRWRGLGEALVRRAMSALAADGHARIGLAVTDGNPAQRLYERLGFVVVETKLSVRIP
jgi:ribosomal protein S18 acetylase RimI-like enzyme